METTLKNTFEEYDFSDASEFHLSVLKVMWEDLQYLLSSNPKLYEYLEQESDKESAHLWEMKKSRFSLACSLRFMIVSDLVEFMGYTKDVVSLVYIQSIYGVFRNAHEWNKVPNPKDENEKFLWVFLNSCYEQGENDPVN